MTKQSGFGNQLRDRSSPHEAGQAVHILLLQPSQDLLSLFVQVGWLKGHIGID